MPISLPLSPQSGLPLDPMTLQALQEQQLSNQVAAGGGTAAWRSNNMAAQQAISSLFPSPAVQQAAKVQQALKQAQVTQQPGESQLDFNIRQLQAQRDAVAQYSPESAAALNTQLTKLAAMKFEQSRLQAADQRTQTEFEEGEPGRQEAERTSNIALSTGITGYVGTNLDSSNPKYTPFDLTTPDGLTAYNKAAQQPGAVKLSQDDIAKITVAKQEALARSSALLGAGVIPQDAKELLYQRYLTTGKLDTSGLYRTPGAVAQLWSYIAQRSAQDGHSAQSAVANGQATAASEAVLKSYQSGADHRNILALNTAVNHLDALGPLADALQSGDLKAFNAARNLFAQQTGGAAPGNFAMMRNIASGEVAKALYNLGGTEAERAAIVGPLETANSPAQLRGAMKTAITALAGRFGPLKEQWDVGTMGRFGDFSRFMSPVARRELGIAPVTPGQQSAPSAAGVDKPASNTPGATTQTPKVLTYDPGSGTFK